MIGNDHPSSKQHVLLAYNFALPYILIKIIMSQWKASSELKKLHTDSNLRTNTSFEFAHSQFDSFHAPPALPNEQTPSLYLPAGTLDNNSTFSLQPTVSHPMAIELLALMEMIRFSAVQYEEKKRLVRRKQNAVDRLGELVTDVEERIKNEQEWYKRKKGQLEQRLMKMGDFKRKRMKAVTEETELMQAEIKYLQRGIKGKNLSRSFWVNNKEEQISRSAHRQNTKKKIYVPIILPPLYNPHSYPNQYPYPVQATPPPYVTDRRNYLEIATHSQKPSNISNPYEQYNLQQQRTSYKEPVIIEQLKQALTIKLKMVQNGYTGGENLDYFDRALDSRSRSRQQGRDTPKSGIQRSSSIKWRKDDNQDKELVEIIEKSMKHIQTEEERPNTQPVQSGELERMSPIRPANRSDSSSINITYDSQDKRNSKSFEKQELSQRKKLSSKNSERNRQIQQSNVKIQMIDMSISKNSASSKSDSSKRVASRYQPALEQKFQEIQEESEELVSLRASPIDNRLKNSFEKELKSQNSKNSKRSQTPSPKPPTTPTPAQTRTSIPKPYQQQQSIDDDILKSIRLDTESRISRNQRLSANTNLNPPEQEGDQLLDGITLLKESKASREKGKSLISSSVLAQELVYQQQQKEKGIQSEIFNRDTNGELPLDFDSSLRLSTRSKIVKNGLKDSQIGKRGQTEPLKGQLTSIPSAEYEQQEDDTPPQSHTRAHK